MPIDDKYQVFMDIFTKELSNYTDEELLSLYEHHKKALEYMDAEKQKRQLTGDQNGK